MKKKPDKIYLLLVMIIVAGFCFSVFYSEKEFRKQQTVQLSKSAQIVSEAVWTLYIDASKSYLQQILHERKYKTLQITTLDKTVLSEMSYILSGSLDQTLISTGLIRTVQLSEEIYYNSQQIGTIRIEVYNTLIYKHFNNLIIAMLLISSLWFRHKLSESKNELENRVRERTRELNENKARLSFALSAARSGIWDWNLETGNLVFDENYYKIAGYEPFEFPCEYEEWRKRIHPEDTEQTVNFVNDYIAGKEKVFSIEFRFKRKDGTWMWILAQGNVTEFGVDGSPIRFTGTHTDITYSKQIVKKLQMSEARYLTLFENNHAVMMLMNPENGDIIDANPAALRYYGFTKEEITSKKIYDINTLSKEEINARMAQAKATDQKVFHMKHRLASGDIRDVEIYSGPIEYDGNKYLFSVIQDISERRKAENELHQFNKNLLQKVNEEIDKNRKQEEIIHNQKKLADMGNMISAISHQWRQPINSLGLLLQDIADAYDTGELDKEYIENIEKESMGIIHHLSSTIDDFRYFYQPDKEPELMQVSEEIFSLLRLTLAQLQNNHIKIRLIYKCGDKDIVTEDLSQKPECTREASYVKGYKGEFKQVIANLIYNSIDAIKDNKSDKGLIIVKIVETSTKVIVTIEDNGGGINDEVAGSIFLPYFTTKKDSNGTGIGLYMSKAIIEEHMHGRIWFESTGDGAKFYLELPKD